MSRLLRGWWPEGVRRVYHRPEVGWLVAAGHAVWEITAVIDIELNTTDRANREHWQTHRPTEEWRNRPFKATLLWQDGVRPGWLGDDNTATVTARSDQSVPWNVYEGGRWPQCSCCGEPMPCRAAITDARVEHEMAVLSHLETKVPGACWACNQPITTRQRSVTYGGENLDLPGGQPVRFHLRLQCRHVAKQYEERWLAKNPGQVRMLTYPYCRGRLVCHGDGTTECFGGHPDCEGHATHDHGMESGCCYVGAGCSRGCDPSTSWVRLPKRPWIRDPGLPQHGHLKGVNYHAGTDPNDMRELCPGVLVVHRDGTTECTAGGLDDCWDDSKYRHGRRKDCCDLTHGCPHCEVAR
jgi:hypothetical protein